MNFARFAVSRPVAVTMRIAALVLLGVVCLGKLSIDLLPKVTIPTVAVITAWPNVAPEEMETQITRPIEQGVSSAPNVYQVSSSTTQGQSVVRVQFNWGADIGQAAIDVLQLVQRARQSFPNDPTLQSPIVFKFDPSTLPIQIYGVSGIDDPIKLRTLLDNEISPIIESANGVASAVISGGQQRAIIVDVDPKKLEAHGVTISDVSKRLLAENINLPAGIAKQGNTEYTIRSVGYFSTPQEAAQIPVGDYNGQLVLLGDVATVKDSNQETRIYTRLNGQPACGLIVVKQSDANTVTTAAAVRDKLVQIKKLYPQLNFKLAYDQSGFIESSVDDLKFTAIIGGTLAVLILMFFLRNLRSTLVVALSIPISIFSTFALIYFCGFTLNTISLSGLALATGLIVDDAVVVLENIFRHIERDKRSAADAAVTGTGEIASAVVASTFTVMVVFLPLMLIKGQAGQTFTQFALVVIFSIGISLLDATTVVPMLASRLIKEREVEEEAHPELRAVHGTRVGPITRAFDWFGRKFSALDAAYRNGLQWALGHRWAIIGGAFGVSACSLLFVPLIGSELLPQTDSGDFTVNVKLPIGTALSKTNEVMKRVEALLTKNSDVNVVFAAAGTTLSLRGTTSSLLPYQGSCTVKLKDDRKHSTQDVIKSVQREISKIPGIRGLVTPYDLVTQILTGGATNMEVDVFGSNLSQLTATSKLTLDAMKAVPGLESVDVAVQEASPELQWKVDRQKAQSLGVSFSDIANALSNSTGGILSSYYQENGYQYPFYVQVAESQRKSIDQLLNLPVETAPSPGRPRQVLLSQVATPQVRYGPAEITRLDRQRYIAVTGRVTDRSESEVQADVTKAMGAVAMPTGVYWDYGQQQQRRGEEFAGLGLAVFMAIALIYMLLASQFESFIYPLVILTSVPVCAVGVVLALLLTGKPFGLTAFIGLLMLVGIVVKNGILLVDYTNQLRGRGIARDEAILIASPTRLRPILMTSCAAILGMLPLAIGFGKGSETEQPLAIAVIGGLTTSTVLTLFVVPCVYSWFDDIGRRFRRDARDLAAAGPVAPTPASVGPIVDPNAPDPSPHSPESVTPSIGDRND